MLSKVTCNITCTISGLTLTIPATLFNPLITSVIQFTIYNLTNPSSCVQPEFYIYSMINSSGII
jgi:hypothetical protein